MDVGLIHQLSGRPGGDREPTWDSTRAAALTAERAGFDMFVYEDVLMYKGEEHTNGCWESMAISGALGPVTSTIRFGQSVINAPYRSPALTASMATTLDEVSGGRYVLGIGAGNSADSDYEGFGFPTDRRYSRFAEAIEIMTTLLRSGSVNYSGTYYSAKDAELVLRGPSAAGPEVNIAAGGPRMLGLVARYANAWNWWAFNESYEDAAERLRPIIERLDQACEEVGRDPATLKRTLDVYSVTPPGFEPEPWMAAQVDTPVAGSVEEIADQLGAFSELGFEEVRLDLMTKGVPAIEAMAPVVEALHAR